MPCPSTIPIQLYTPRVITFAPVRMSIHKNHEVIPIFNFVARMHKRLCLIFCFNNNLYKKNKEIAYFNVFTL